MQLALLHVPAVMVHGNTLELDEYAHWYTPALIMGGWSHKLRHNTLKGEWLTTASDAVAKVKDLLPPDPAPSVPANDNPPKPAAPGIQLKLFG